MFRRRQSPAQEGTLQPGDAAYLTDMRAAQAAEGTPQAVWAIYLMLALLAAAITWAATTRVDEVTRANGRIVPEGREQVIASLEGGILREMYVREGMQVSEGQDLAQLDPTRFEAQQNEGQAKRLALKGTIARLTAESTGRALSFPDDVAAAERVVEGETDSYQARKYALDEAVQSNQRSIALVMRELNVAESMAGKGLMSEVEVVRLRRQVNDLRQQTQERINRFRQDASADLVRVQNELSQLDEQLAGREDVLRRTVLKSPVKGLVKNIRITTLGGVVSPGAPIMEIVPISPRVLVEARVKPSDIGFVRVGQVAEVKLTAYDYTSYGSLHGTVSYISPDALGDTDPQRGTGPDNTYYRVIIRTERTASLREKGKPLPVLPGMTATVDMRTGERSVLNFLLRPMLKSKEAFRER
ncbi:MAG TPA: HlyD family type I secretion periplasmic adaptor subunit [Burkholderiaceae bacterium]|nr:HlyD family type I secretion periplasmic adaptor subunit [Burkholderiaceae bacterium]